MAVSVLTQDSNMSQRQLYVVFIMILALLITVAYTLIKDRKQASVARQQTCYSDVSEYPPRVCGRYDSDDRQSCGVVTRQ